MVMVTFIEILNRLTSDEILILEYINSPQNIVAIPNLSDEEAKQYKLPTDISAIAIHNSFPVIDIRIFSTDIVGFKNHTKNFNSLDEKIHLSAPENIYSYIDNMTSLGLVERKPGIKFAIEKIYYHLENHKSIINFKSSLNESTQPKIEFERGRIDITDLGEKLLLLCSKK
jgi:Abortive infection alpha